MPDLGHFVCHIILAEDISLDNPGLLGLDNIADSLGKYGVAVVGAAVSGKEADEALP